MWGKWVYQWGTGQHTNTIAFVLAPQKRRKCLLYFSFFFFFFEREKEKKKGGKGYSSSAMLALGLLRPDWLSCGDPHCVLESAPSPLLLAAASSCRRWLMAKSRMGSALRGPTYRTGCVLLPRSDSRMYGTPGVSNPACMSFSVTSMRHTMKVLSFQAKPQEFRIRA